MAGGRTAGEPHDGSYQVICDGIVGPGFVDLFRVATRERALPLR